MTELITSPEPFVGRETELHELHQILKMVMRTQQPKFVLMQGDFGMGKTTLVTHFMSEASSQHLTLLSGQGRSGSGGLVPFGQLLVTLGQAGIQRGAILGDPLEFIQEVAPAWSDIFTACAASPEMKSTAKTVEESKELPGHSTYSTDLVSVQFTNTLTKLAEKHPILAFIDDLQWADKSSLDLLFHLACCLQNRSVLFVCAYRLVEAMEAGPDTDRFRDVRANLISSGAIELELNQGINVADYAAQRYPLNAFSQEFIAHAQELTGGHALHVSQLFSLWQETGVIALTSPTDGQAVWISPQGAEAQAVITKKLSVVLEERIRPMEDELQRSLTIASVEGEDFTAQVVARLQQLDEAKVYDSLEALEQRYRLIQEQEQKPETSNAPLLDFYRFVHRFFRDYIYSKLSSAKRRTLHRRVGECLEALYSDRRPIAGQLARHFREADQPFKAARYARMAAEFEQSHYAWAEGEHWCEFGLELLETLSPEEEIRRLQEAAAPIQRRLAAAHENLRLIQERKGEYVQSTEVPLQLVKEERRWQNKIDELELQLDGAASASKQSLQLDLLEQSGDGHYYSSKFTQADRRYRAALELAQQLSVDVERTAGLFDKLADTCWYERQSGEVKPLLDQGMQVLDRYGVPLGEVRIRLELQWGFIQADYYGHNDVAVQSLRQTLGESESLPPTRTLERAKARGYNWLAIALSNLNYYLESAEAYRKSIQIADAIDERVIAGTSRLNLAYDLVNQGRFEEGEALLAEGIQSAHQIGDMDNEADARSNRIGVLLARGQPSEAIVESGKIMEILEEDSWQMPYVYADLSTAYLALSDLERAYQAATRGVACAEQNSDQEADQEGLSYAFDALAQVEAARQDWELATQHFNQAIAAYQQAGDRHMAARVQRHLAEALLRKGERSQAIELLQTALATFQELGLAYDVAETQRLWDTTQIQ